MSKKSKPGGWPEIFPAAFGGFLNPQEGEAPSPFAESISGGMDFMKAMMGGMPTSVPGFVMPTVDLDELDKRIKDLRAVESWLELNANMLRATIQGLDVQRNTIAALKSYGGAGTAMAKTLANRVAAQGDALAKDDGSKAEASSLHGGHVRASWPMPQAMHAQHQGLPRAAQEEFAPIQRASSAKGKRSKTAAKAKAKPQAAKGRSAIDAGAPATAWMNFLQDQFARVAKAAVAKAPPPGSVAAAPAKAAAKKVAPRRKSARKKAQARRVLAPRA